MSVAAIPFLISIISGIGSILKAIWDFAKQRAIIVVYFLGRLTKWVAGLLTNYVTYKYVLFAALTVLFTLTINKVVSVISFAFDIKSGWDNLLSRMPGFAWVFWNEDGILRFKHAFDDIMALIPVYLSGIFAAASIRALRTMATIALNAKLGGR